MGHTYTSNFVHCIFSTKERKPNIAAGRTAALYSYLGGIARSEGFTLVAAGGTANHVHLLVILPAGLSVATAVQKLKGSSSRWLGKEFAWQEGSGGIWSVQRECVPGSDREEVYRRPGGASPEEEF